METEKISFAERIKDAPRAIGDAIRVLDTGRYAEGARPPRPKKERLLPLERTLDVGLEAQREVLRGVISEGVDRKDTKRVRSVGGERLAQRMWREMAKTVDPKNWRGWKSKVRIEIKPEINYPFVDLGAFEESFWAKDGVRIRYAGCESEDGSRKNPGEGNPDKLPFCVFEVEYKDDSSGRINFESRKLNPNIVINPGDAADMTGEKVLVSLEVGTDMQERAVDWANGYQGDDEKLERFLKRQTPATRMQDIQVYALAKGIGMRLGLTNMKEEDVFGSYQEPNQKPKPNIFTNKYVLKWQLKPKNQNKESLVDYSRVNQAIKFIYGDEWEFSDGGEVDSDNRKIHSAHGRDVHYLEVVLRNRRVEEGEDRLRRGIR